MLTIYCEEAHPVGGWEAPDQPHKVKQATTTTERVATAKSFIEKLNMGGHIAVDGINNEASLRYQTFPDRIMVVGKDNELIYVQKPGPVDYQPPELRSFLQKLK